MIHRHGFPPGTDRTQAEATAVAEYRKLGGPNPDPHIEYVDAADELIVVVRTEPQAKRT